MFFFKGENTIKETLQRLLAPKYATKDMDCPFHPKIVHCFLIASSSEHWEPREIEAIKCKCLIFQPPGNPGGLLVRGGDPVKVLQNPVVDPLQANVPWRHLWWHMQYISQASSSQGLRAWVSHWMLLLTSPLQYSFQDPVLPGLLPFAVLIWPFLWKGPYESKGWVWYGVGNICEKKGKCSDAC